MSEFRNRILARAPQSPTLIPLDMEEWGEVYIKVWSSGERDDYEAAQVERGKEGKALVSFRAHFVAACLVSADGSPVFTGDDVESLSKLPSAEVNKAFKKCQKYNGMDEDEVEAKRMAKNS